MNFAHCAPRQASGKLQFSCPVQWQPIHLLPRMYNGGKI